MVARASRRLPGFRFEAQSSRLTEALPRMDVAVFVGFAASGPLQTPVPLEDAAQFAAIFGEDAVLLWDKERGAELRAHLAPAVRNFFGNGGRRCWIVRVAGQEARSNHFPIPGFAEARFDAAGADQACLCTGALGRQLVRLNQRQRGSFEQAGGSSQVVS